MATHIMLWGLRVNKYATDKYTITDIYIPIKDIQGQEMITYI